MADRKDKKDNQDDKNASADIAFIRSLARLAKSSDLAEIAVEREVESEGSKPRKLKVRIARDHPGDRRGEALTIQSTRSDKVSSLSVNSVPETVPLVHSEMTGNDNSADEAALLNSPGLVKSPMVGTVYLAPEPGAPNYVGVGDMVNDGQTLLIIEAMKTMNHIAAPHAGRVARVIVKNGDSVEFGSPLLVLES